VSRFLKATFIGQYCKLEIGAGATCGGSDAVPTMQMQRRAAAIGEANHAVWTVMRSKAGLTAIL
jgi:hypothetical protein